MKSRDALIRLKRFQVEERRRRVAQIETMINEFTRMASELDREIASEETRAGNTDPSHFAYPTYARAATAGVTISSIQSANCTASWPKPEHITRRGKKK